MIKKGSNIDYLITSFPKLYNGVPEFNKTTIVDERQFFLIDKVVKLNQNNNNTLDEEFIKENYDLESVFLKISDRLCFYPKTVKIRQMVYYELLLYWKTFFERNEIKIIIFPRTPHLGYGNIVWHLAKKLGIEIWIVQETSLNNKVFLTHDPNTKIKIPENYLPNKTIPSLEKQLGKDILSLINLSSSLMNMNYSDNRNVLQQNKTNFINQLFNFKNYKNLFLALNHHPFKRSIQSFLYLEEPTSWFKSYFILLRYYIKNRYLLSFYRTITQLPNYSSKFIYFPLHYQPEKTSLPEGGVYEDMLLIVDTLAKSLPKNWFLYVKEHPYQFTRSDPRLYNFRSKYFYSKIISYENVKLLPMEISPHQLIKNSQAVVTVTGSTGWEALVFGKPVMLFSSAAWYWPCNSCFNISSQKVCREVIQKVASWNNNRIRKDLLRFLIFYKNKFIDSTNMHQLIKDNQTVYKECVDNLASALAAKINS